LNYNILYKRFEYSKIKNKVVSIYNSLVSGTS